VTSPARPVQTHVVLVGSAATRAHLVRALQAEGDIVVVGQSADGADAVRLAVELHPHLVVLDLYPPDGVGVGAVEQIMGRTPTPILVLSRQLDDPASPAVAAALAAGALEALPEPLHWTPGVEARLRRSVRLLRKVHVIRQHHHGSTTPAPSARSGDHHLVAVGASTGGPSALATLLAGLHGLSSPVLVVQHLHPDFTSGLVDWMARVSALPVQVAEHGLEPRPGRVYIAPGGTHLRLTAELRLELDAAPAALHRPSVDELFHSVATHAGAAATGVLLTGMGEDGARGLLAIHQRGGVTLAQDEDSCAVFGMPAAARRLGAVTEMLTPAEIARAITHARRSGHR
jgi:two-component system, chemotaxis family, protein-glutamate methylesterase/glutaminase